MGGILVDKIIEVSQAWKVNASGRKTHEGGLEALASVETFAHRSQDIVLSNPASKHPLRSDPQRLQEAAWRVPVLNRESVSSTGTAREATPGWSRVGWEMIKYTMTYATHVHDIWKVISNVPLTADEESQLRRFGESERPLEEAKLKMTKNNEFYHRAEHSTYQVLLDAFKERKPFLGKHGSVGIGPLSVREGDLVCVLHGGSFPFILRKTESMGVYHLVGEAYCDGVMAGEALRMGLPVRDFILE